MNVPTLSEIGVSGLIKAVAAAGTLAVAWLSWLTSGYWEASRGLQERPTREQTEQIVAVASPYNADRKLILQHMSDRAKVEERLLQSMDKQTDSIRRIETEIARFSALLREQHLGQIDDEEF